MTIVNRCKYFKQLPISPIPPPATIDHIGGIPGCAFRAPESSFGLQFPAQDAGPTVSSLNEIGNLQ